MTEPTRGARLIWWARPNWICLWLMLPIVILAFINAEDLAAARQVKSLLNVPMMLVLLIVIAVLVFGSFVGGRLRLPEKAGRRFPPWVLDLLFWVSVVAFAIWFHALLTNPALFLAMLLGTDGTVYSIRGDNETIPGVTTLSQCSLAFVCVIAYQYPRLRGLRRRHKLYLAGILVMSVFRTLAWSERLCLIEISVPLVLAFTRYAPGERAGRLFRAVPLAAFGMLYALFAVTEYFRSWTASYKDRYDSLFEFVTLRISEYYFFAINSGLALLDRETSNFPHYSMLWLEKFPVLGNLLVKSFHITSARGDYLESDGAAELTNFGGLPGLIVDYGVIGGGFATLGLGLLAGIACRRFANSNGYLGLIYPLFFMTLVDLPREFYIGDPRAFVPIFVLALFWIFFSRRERSSATTAVKP